MTLKFQVWSTQQVMLAFTDGLCRHGVTGKKNVLNVCITFKELVDQTKGSLSSRGQRNPPHILKPHYIVTPKLSKH